MGLGALATPAASHAAASLPKAKRLPREVWIATVAQDGMLAQNYKQMTRMMLDRMEQIVPLQPDIICLPEVFPFVNTATGRPPLAEAAEQPIGSISKPFAEFAEKHNCYVVCPIYTTDGTRFYNASVFIDRKGQLLGEYRKMHPTTGEMQRGIAPGPTDPPVFQADFGKIGSQICFDIEWSDGWRKLRSAGAEIVFWPSAFAGGKMVNTKAWENKYCVVSSTRKGTSKICDVSGQPAGWTSRWNRWSCVPINLEKAFLHTWPFCRHFKDIYAKYGRKVRITTFAEEEWTIIESRSPDLTVADVLNEFNIQTHEQHIQEADQAQRKAR